MTYKNNQEDHVSCVQVTSHTPSDLCLKDMGKNRLWDPVILYYILFSISTYYWDPAHTVQQPFWDPLMWEKPIMFPTYRIKANFNRLILRMEYSESKRRVEIKFAFAIFLLPGTQTYSQMQGIYWSGSAHSYFLVIPTIGVLIMTKKSSIIYVLKIFHNIFKFVASWIK